jgi:FkbM family methyltransferase
VGITGKNKLTINVNLMGNDYPVIVCDDSALIGGSFYENPLRPYSPVPIKWCWDQLIRYPRAVFIDCGASAGSFSLLAKHHPDLHVYAFEPVPLAARILRENVYLNDLMDKVTVLETGVSNYSGNGTMHVVKDIGGLGVSLLDGIPAYHKDCADLQVKVVKIDDICLHETGDIIPTLIKSDCEGSDLFTLQGAEKTIQKYHPFLCIEYSQENADQFGYPVHRIVELVEDFGYTWISPEGIDLFCVHKEWDKNGNT